MAETFAEADRVMTPLLGKPLTEFIFVDQADADAVAKAEEDLRQTEITQPAVLAIDLALTRLLAAYGIEPDFTMGHSLGEYGALVAAGGLPFADSLEAVSARGRGMTQVAMNDNGRMAAVFAPLEEIERILKTIDGYVVIANVNSNRQAVIGGASKAVEQAMEAFQKAGYEVSRCRSATPSIHQLWLEPANRCGGCWSACICNRRACQSSPTRTASFIPPGRTSCRRCSTFSRSRWLLPCSSLRACRPCTTAGARMFVEVGPKKALQGFAEDVLGSNSDVVSLFTNHPKVGDIVAFNQALCGLYAAGLGRGTAEAVAEPVANLRHGFLSAEIRQTDPRGSASPCERARTAPSQRRSIQRTRPIVRRRSRSRLRNLSRQERAST